MFQTSPANAGIATLGLEPSGNNPGHSADSNDAFSQEFDKQVKNLSHKEAGAAPATSAKARSDSEQEEPAQDASSEEQGEDNAQPLAATPEEPAGGKDLPPSLADWQNQDEPAAEPVPEEGAAGEAVAAELAGAGLDQQGAVAVEALAPVQPLKASSLESAVREAIVGKPEMATDEALSPLRLREVLSQRFANIRADNGGQASLAREGKFDLQGLLSGNLQAGTTAASDGGNAAVVPPGLNPAVAPGNASTAPLALTLAVPLQQKGWDQALGERMVWLARSNIQEAQLQLNPRELGPIEIKIAVKQDQAHVQFVAHHATTREALEAAMPRLREMLNDSGLNLAQSDVSQHSFREGGQNTQAQSSVRGAAAEGGMDASEGAEGPVVSHVSQVAPRGIDYFA